MLTRMMALRRIAERGQDIGYTRRRKPTAAMPRPGQLGELFVHIIRRPEWPVWAEFLSIKQSCIFSTVLTHAFRESASDYP